MNRRRGESESGDSTTEFEKLISAAYSAGNWPSLTVKLIEFILEGNRDLSVAFARQLDEEVSEFRRILGYHMDQFAALYPKPFLFHSFNSKFSSGHFAALGIAETTLNFLKAATATSEEDGFEKELGLADRLMIGALAWSQAIGIAENYLADAAKNSDLRRLTAILQWERGKLLKGEIPIWPNFEAIRNSISATSGAATLKEEKQRETVSSKMISMASKKPESRSWTVRKWATALDCSASTVAATEAWKAIKRMQDNERHGRMNSE